MKRVLIAAGIVIGIVLFAVVFHYAGVSDVERILIEGSPLFLLLFLTLSFIEFFAMALKWFYIVRSEGGYISLRQAFSFRLMGQSLNYITPAARMGGTPWMAYMLNKHSGMRLSRGLSTVLIDKAFELGVELALSSVFVLVMVLFFPLPKDIKTLGIIFAFCAAFIPVLFFFALLRDWKPLSAIFRLIAWLSHHRLVQWAKDKAINVERYVRLFLKLRKKSVLKAIGLNSFVWAFRFLEFKLALLVFGYNASPAILFAAMVMCGIVGLVPIPGALGVLEAGQMSVFAAFGARPDMGLVLAIVLRVRDIIFTLSGVYLVSHEGVGIVEALRRNA